VSERDSHAGDDESRTLAAQAEDERRAGRPENAREFAQAALETESPHPAAHVAYVLALIDSGDLVTAHRALEGAYVALGGELLSAPEAPLAKLADDELESAFENAEAQADEMHDANDVAAAALQLVEDGDPEGVDLASEASPFATETVASLLENQGQSARAEEVRVAARRRGRFRDVRMEEARRERVVATLGRWLENLRRRTA
jgi:hypothetical protein